MTAPACFNCGTPSNVQMYGFDLDLPSIAACKRCIFALSMGDDDLLKALRPRRTRGRKPVSKLRE